jgi:hypothetical protein
MQGFPEELKKFISRVEWTFAKTMPDWPHSYIVRSAVDDALFVKLVEHIRKFGYEGSFYQTKLIYFEEDRLIYWTMGNPVEETTILNRTVKENSYKERVKNGTLPL